MTSQPELRLSTPRRTASYQDLRGGTVVHVNPQPNGHSKYTQKSPKPTVSTWSCPISLSIYIVFRFGAEIAKSCCFLRLYLV